MLAVLSAPDATVLAAFVVGIPSTIAAINSVLGKREARAANQAVNNVGPDAPKIYDLVEQHGRQLDRLTDQVDDINATVKKADRKLTRHLEWHQVHAEQGDRAAGSPLGALDEHERGDW